MAMNSATPRLNRLTSGPAPGWIAVSRGAALGLSSLIVLNLLEVFVHATSAVENWFCSLEPLTQPVCITVLAMAATGLLMFSIKPALPGPVWIVSMGSVLLLCGFCGRELWRLSQAVPEALRTTAMARPLGVVMLLAVVGIGISLGNSTRVRGRSSFLVILFSSILAITGFAVVTIQSGGIADSLSDSEVPAILVVGFEPEGDGTSSVALSDRVKTGCRLLLEKHGKVLVLSGMQQNGTISELDAMQKAATAAGVPSTLVVLDPNSRNTSESVRFAASLPELIEDPRLIGVGHWYQLARIRLLARRSGLSIVAVTSEPESAQFNSNMLVAREISALLRTFCDPAIEFGRQAVRPVDASGTDQRDLSPP